MFEADIYFEGESVHEPNKGSERTRLVHTVNPDRPSCSSLPCDSRAACIEVALERVVARE